MLASSCSHARRLRRATAAPRGAARQGQQDSWRACASEDAPPFGGDGADPGLACALMHTTALRSQGMLNAVPAAAWGADTMVANALQQLERAHQEQKLVGGAPLRAQVETAAPAGDPHHDPQHQNAEPNSEDTADDSDAAGAQPAKRARGAGGAGASAGGSHSHQQQPRQPHSAAANPFVNNDHSGCRNHTGYIGVRKRNWGMYAAEIRDGSKRRYACRARQHHIALCSRALLCLPLGGRVACPTRARANAATTCASCCTIQLSLLLLRRLAANLRWLGSFSQAEEAGMAYDAALILQKKHRAKTNFIYSDFATIPRPGAEHAGKVRYSLIPKYIMEVRPCARSPPFRSSGSSAHRCRPPNAASGAALLATRHVPHCSACERAV